MTPSPHVHEYVRLRVFDVYLRPRRYASIRNIWNFLGFFSFHSNDRPIYGIQSLKCFTEEETVAV